MNFDLIEKCFYICNLSYENIETIYKLNNQISNDSELINKNTNSFLKSITIDNLYVNDKLHLGLPNILHYLEEETLFISFSGLRSKNDLATCLNFILKYDENLNCNLHRGFISHFSKLKDEVELLVKFYNKINNIIFTGHSLGGAMAKLSALYIKRKYCEKNICCYTFANPIMGDNSFANLYDETIQNSLSINSQKDFLTKIPLFRRCNEKNKYMISNGKIEKYHDICYSYIFNFFKLDFKFHRLKYYYNLFVNLEY